MSIKCIAIDDEPLALSQIGSYIKTLSNLELVCLCSNAFDALKAFENNKIDLIFVDIEMPDLNGLDFVRSLPSKPFIVFTTAYSEYAVEGFKVDAVDYLLKPIGYNDFLRAVNKVSALLSLHETQPETVKTSENHLFVKSDYKIMRIVLSDIKYIESMHEYIRIHLVNEKPVMTLVSLKAIEEQLPADKFMRVHRSFIVNLDLVKVIERNRIVFDNSIYIPVSEQYKEKFQSFIEKNFLI
ncbi:MAG: LytTR family DNA-binding domain-containing protein [Bacteroidales bacterium]